MVEPVASLPMYDLPEVRAATDALWYGLSLALRAAGVAETPMSLDRSRPYREPWTDSGLVMSQTCGYPLVHELNGRVRLVATPCYATADCDGPTYCSYVVVRADDAARDIEDLRGRRCAFNSRTSQSGYNALRALIAPLAGGGSFFAAAIESGGHGKSMELVATGAADMAAVDCVTFALVGRYRPAAVAGLRILCRTPSAPGLPLVTRAAATDDDIRRLRAGLSAVIADPGLAPARETLLIRDFAVLPLSAYDRILEMEQSAVTSRYPSLR